MKIPIQPSSIDLNDIKTKLEARFPMYNIKSKAKNLIMVKKSGAIGAAIRLKKKKILIGGTFPTVKAQLIFIFFMLFTILLLTVLVYFIFFHGRMKKLEREIGKYLSEEIT